MNKLLLLPFVILVPRLVDAAPCDVTLDPGAPLQAAVDAASPGDVLCRAPGVHALSSTLLLDAGITLQGPQFGVDPRRNAQTSRFVGDPTTEAILDGHSRTFAEVKAERLNETPAAAEGAHAA